MQHFQLLLKTLNLTQIKDGINTLGINNDGVIEDSINISKHVNEVISNHIGGTKGMSSGDEVIDNKV